MISNSLTEHDHPLERRNCKRNVLLREIEGPYVAANALYHLLAHLRLGLNAFNFLYELCALDVDLPELLPRGLACVGLLTDAGLDLLV